MREKDFISVIKRLSESNYIGDDCAYLKDLGIVVTQDSLVEDVHFKLEYITPFQLGYKSVMVNLSDVAASGADAAYITISLSLPSYITEDFVENFYKGVKEACAGKVQVIGGDITGGDKVFISICAIGKTCKRQISSRRNAKVGYKVLVSGVHGSSSVGLQLLLEGKKQPEKFIKSHLLPQAQIEFGARISQNVCEDYAMMDTSDGLMDALSTIANDSEVLLEIDFNKIPIDKDLKAFSNWQDLVLFGGEDYGIVAVVPQSCPDFGVEIGQVKKGLGVDLLSNDGTVHYLKQDVENKVFNHFKTTFDDKICTEDK